MNDRNDTIAALKAQTAAVSASDSMSEAARKSLLDDLIAMLEHEEGSRSGEDIIDVHDMRVATRRMRSVMQLLADYFKPKALDHFRDQLKRVATALGDVRDLDVMIDNLERFKTTLIAEAQRDLDAAIALLDHQREDARKRLTRALDKGDYQRFITDFSAFVTTASADKGSHDSGKQPAPTQARYVLPVEVYSHLALVRAYDQILETADDTRLHQLRIEIKRLRYLLSVFDDLLTSSGKEFVGELKQLQDQLGKLHDAVVAQQQLGALKANLSESQGAALQIYLNTVAAEASKMREQFPESWKHFNSKGVQRQLASALAGL